MNAVIQKSEYWNGGWMDSTEKASYVGTNYHDFYTYVLYFTAPEFQGISKAVNVELGMTAGGDVKTPTLRWALCTSGANKALYVDTYAEVTDEYQVASGVFTTGKLSSVSSGQTIGIQTSMLKAGQEYVLFVWGYAPPSDPEWAKVMSISNHEVSVEVIGGIVRVSIGGEIRVGTPVVKHEGQIHACMVGVIRNGEFSPGT